MASIRTCIVAGSHPPILCGIGDYTAPLARALSGKGVDAFVLVSPEGVPQPNGGDELPYELIAVPGWSLRHVLIIWQFIASINPDVVHVVYPGRAYGYGLAPILTPYIARAVGLPSVLTLHEFKMARLLRKLADIALMLPMHAILVPSASERDAIARCNRNLASKVMVSTAGPTIRPQWLSEDERIALRHQLGIGADAFAIAYFGFIHPHKGTKHAIEVFARVSERLSNVWLIVIGAFEPALDRYHAVIHQLAIDLSINERIRWMGAQPPQRVSHLLQICDVALLPFPDGASTRRGTLIVSIQHGLPVITTAGERAIFERFGEAVLTVDSINDIDGMAHYIVKLFGDREWLFALKQYARTRMPDWNTAWDEIANHTLEMYNDVLKRDARKAR